MSTTEATAERQPLALNELLSLIQAEGVKTYTDLIDTRILSIDDFELFAVLTEDQLGNEVALRLLGAMRTARFAAAVADGAQLESGDVYEDIEALYSQVHFAYIAEQAVAIQEQMDVLNVQMDEYKAILRTMPGGTHHFGDINVSVKPATKINEGLLRSMLDAEQMKALYEQKFSPTLARNLVDKTLLAKATEEGTTAISVKRRAQN